MARLEIAKLSRWERAVIQDMSDGEKLGFVHGIDRYGLTCLVDGCPYITVLHERTVNSLRKKGFIEMVESHKFALTPFAWSQINKINKWNARGNHRNDDRRPVAEPFEDCDVCPHIHNADISCEDCENG